MGEQLSTEQRVRALVVDDESALVRVVAEYLEREGFEVVTQADGVAALALTRGTEPDVVVLDVRMPGIDGIEVCRQLRTFSDAYVIMLTARVDEIDTLVGLSVGADDDLTNPFSPRGLVARIRSLLRRLRRLRRLRTAVEPVTRTEFDLLDTLSSRPRTAFTRTQLIERV